MGDELPSALEQIADGTWSLKFPDDMTDITQVTAEELGEWDEYLSPKFRAQLECDDSMPNKAKVWMNAIYAEANTRAYKDFIAHIQTEGKHPYDLEVNYKTYKGNHIRVRCTGEAVFVDGRPVTMEGMHILLEKRSTPFENFTQE